MKTGNLIMLVPASYLIVEDFFSRMSLVVFATNVTSKNVRKKRPDLLCRSTNPAKQNQSNRFKTLF